MEARNPLLQAGTHANQAPHPPEPLWIPGWDAMFYEGCLGQTQSQALVQGHHLLSFRNGSALILAIPGVLLLGQELCVALGLMPTRPWRWQSQGCLWGRSLSEDPESCHSLKAACQPQHLRKASGKVGILIETRLWARWLILSALCMYA